MKSQKVTALLLSMALSISTCMPLGSITALGAETGATAEAVEVQEEVSDPAKSAASSQEEEDSSQADGTEQAAFEEEEASEERLDTPAEETGPTETEDTENVTMETEDEGNANSDVDETDADASAQETESPQINEEADYAASEESPASSDETPTEDQSDLSAPAETETVNTDAQNSLATPTSVDFSNAVEIKAGDTFEVNITEAGGYALYRFVPEETAEYYFYSFDNDGDSYAALYDSGQNQIDYSDDEGGDRNFRIEQSLNADEVYYFQAYMYGSNTGSYKVSLIKNDFHCEQIGESERTVSPGEEVTLEVSASSSSAISYQWYDDNSDPIEGAASTSYTFTAENNESYFCNITDESGNSRYLYFYITIDNELKAYPEGGDEDDSYQSIEVSPNTPVDLKVVVSALNMSGLTYQWYDNDGNLIENAGSTTYTTDPITKYSNYRFRVSDSYGNYEDVYFSLSVENHLEAYTLDESGEHVSYSNVYAEPNASATLNVTVSAEDMTGLIYQWYDSDDNLIENADGTTYVIDAVTKYSNYRFQVTDPYGNQRNVYFYIRVQNQLKASPKDSTYGASSYIYAPPRSSVDLEVTVSAKDMSQLTYTWYDDDGDIVSTNSTTYRIASLTEREYYRFSVSDQYNNTATVYFYVYVENNLNAYPEGEDESDSYAEIGVSPGTSADLNVIVMAEDTSQITYSWSDDDWNPIEDAVSSSFRSGPVTSEKTYHCTVSDQYGNSDDVSFTVYAENHLMAYAKGSNPYSHYKEVYVLPNSPADLIAVVSADDMSQLSREWYDSDGDLLSSDTTSFSIDSVTKEARYVFTVSDQYGNSCSIDFYVYVDNNLIVQAVDGKRIFYVPPGSSVEAGVIVSADDNSQITYDWYDNNGDIIETADSSSYKIDSVTESQSLRCDVFDQYGDEETIYFYIHVNNLIAYPEGEAQNRTSKTINVAPGQSVDLKVNVSADDMSQVTYKWYDSNGLVDNADTSSFTVESVEKTQRCRCYVSDQYSNTKVVYFTLNVQNNLEAYPEEESVQSTEKTVYVAKNKSAVLKADVSADDMTGLSYEWYNGNNKLVDSSGPVYTTEPITRSQNYSLWVRDSYGNSKYIDFYVIVQNHLTAHPKGEEEDSSYSVIYADYGDSVNLEAVTSADDMSQITYTWFNEQTDKHRRGSSSYQTDPLLYECSYRCYISDQYGNSCSLRFIVRVNNNLRAYPEGEAENSTSKDIYIESGQSASLKALVSADNEDDLSYLWREYVWDDYYGQYEYRRIGRAYTASYTTKPLEEDRTYLLRVLDCYGNTKEIQFNVIIKNLEKQTISADDQLSLVYGSNGTISVSGAKGVLNFTSSNPAIASVDSAGKVTANKIGSTEITVYAAATDTYNVSNRITVNVTVTAKSIKNAVVSGIQNKTYNGSAQTQNPVVKLGSTTLTEGTDYTITYSNNVNAGKATLTITGKGNYTGTLPPAEFTINPASIKDADVTGLEDKTYNGEEQTQTPVVKVGSTTLENEKDYTVSYSSNTNAGTASVTITGIGNYTGTLPAAEFTINPASIKDAEVTGIVDKTYDGSEQTQSPVVKVGSVTLENERDYTVSYSNNVEKGTATLTITGKGNYTGTVTRQFTISDKLSLEIAEVEEITGLVYSGEEQKPTPVVKIGSTTLTEGTDYTIDSYSNNINASTATMTITGKGNYINSKIITFTINPAKIDSTDISGIVKKTYNGKPQTQTPVLKLGTVTLAEGTDYTVSYSSNTNAGTAKVTFTAVEPGNFTGATDRTFTINKAAQNFTVKAAASSIDVGKTTKVTANGAKENPKYTFTSSNAKIATVNTAGTVTGKAAGTVTITVKAGATANYKELSKTVKITVNKVLKKPGNCHFIKWNNSKYTGCRIGWKKTEGADGYQTLLSWTDGSHASSTIVKSNVLYRDCTVHPQHVSQMKVRAFYMQNGQRKFGPWSNVEYITPSPAKLTTRNTSSGNNLKMNVSWNIIYGCNGYNVFITTNPNGKWYWYQSTSQKATATSAVINKCGGSALKKNTRYYVRIVTRRKRNGVFCTVPMPANNTYVGSFVIK